MKDRRGPRTGTVESDQQVAPSALTSSGFRFVDLFAGIGGMRAGLELAGGTCVYSVEIDKYAQRTYAANWGPINHGDIRTLELHAIPAHDLLAAGFPCQPFSLAGVSKKNSLRMAHGFDDAKSGDLFFQIIRVIGGPWNLSDAELQDEALAPDSDDARFASGAAPSLEAPPLLLLENVRHLLSHDGGRTWRVIRRRLMRSGYLVAATVVNAAAWVPQNRRRTVITAVRSDLFDRPLVLPPPPDPRNGPRFSAELLESDPAIFAAYRLTPGVWRALRAHRDRHAAKGQGFGYGFAEVGRPTRTLSARYYKDGAEILVRMPDGSDPPRRLTPRECARLMGFSPEHLGREFALPQGVSDVQAYRQFGNSVVVPQFAWIAKAVINAAGPVLAEWRATAGRHVA